jgi:hypothetical protein
MMLLYTDYVLKCQCFHERVQNVNGVGYDELFILQSNGGDQPFSVVLRVSI